MGSNGKCGRISRWPRAGTGWYGCVVVVLLMASVASAEITHSTIILSSDDAPGLDGYRFNFTLFAPHIGDGGSVMFQASATPIGGGTSVGGVWTAPLLASPLELLVRQGAEAPGTGGATFTGFNSQNFSLRLGAGGHTAFISSVSAGGSGVWVGTPGAMQLLVRVGDPNPANPAEQFVSLSGPVDPGLRVNRHGVVAIRGTVADPSNPFQSIPGFWAGTPGNLTQLVRHHMPSGIEDRLIVFGGGPFQELVENIPHINDSGQIAFLARVSGFPTGSDPKGVFIAGPGGVQAVAHSAGWFTDDPLPGSEAPGVPGNRARITNLNQPAFNNAGQVAFRAEVSSSEMYGDAIYRGTPGDVELIARSGAVAPGTGGLTFGFSGPNSNVPAFGKNVVINDAGVVGFTAGLMYGEYDPLGNSVWRGTPNGLELIAYHGMSAPGLGSNFSFTSSFENLRINRDSQLAFTATLEEAGPFPQYRNSLWVTSLSGSVPELIVREGQQLEVRAGDFRNVTQIRVSDSYFNDNGQVAYLLDLFDPVRFTTRGIFLTGTQQLIGVDYYWRGSQALDDNWHTISGNATNWRDSLGEVRTLPPMDAPTQNVIISDAPEGGVILDQFPVSVRSLAMAERPARAAQQSVAGGRFHDTPADHGRPRQPAAGRDAGHADPQQRVVEWRDCGSGHAR